ncbi:MAG: type II/IV secretion system protein, partial [Phycisphaerae bacterium]
RMDREVAARGLSVKSRDTQIHPLVLLAEMNLRVPDEARGVLDIERLTRWLAERSGLPYQHIDPLRVDFARVVDIFSSNYATSHAILPLAIHGAEVVVATCEPFADEW